MEIEDFNKLMEYREYEKEQIQYLIYFFDNEENTDFHEFLSHSEFYWAPDIYSIDSNTRFLNIISAPEIYKKYYTKLDSFKETIKNMIYEISGVKISRNKIKPNLKKFQISANRYVPVLTPWDEINKNQNILLRQFRESKESIDYQNIGNTCRMIMQQISNIVFDINIHTDTNGKSVQEKDFKNRLHAYIKTELGGSSNKKLRAFSLALIDSAEKGVNLANDLTHSLNADSLIAESSVISTISLINIVRIIEKNKNAL
jgi:hypothetical protein